jgi:hypothetical protein
MRHIAIPYRRTSARHDLLLWKRNDNGQLELRETPDHVRILSTQQASEVMYFDDTKYLVLINREPTVDIRGKYTIMFRDWRYPLSGNTPKPHYIIACDVAYDKELHCITFNHWIDVDPIDNGNPLLFNSYSVLRCYLERKQIPQTESRLLKKLYRSPSDLFKYSRFS